MGINWDTFILILISVFTAFFFERLIRIAGYLIAKIFYKQNWNVSLYGAIMGALSFLFMILIFSGIFMQTDERVILARRIFILAGVIFLIDIIPFEYERRRIAKLETRGYKILGLFKTQK